MVLKQLLSISPVRRSPSYLTTSHRHNSSWSREFLNFLRPPPPPDYFTPPPKLEVIAGKIIGGVCFFWIYYKMYHNGTEYLGLKDKFEGLYDYDYDKGYISLARTPVSSNH